MYNACEYKMREPYPTYGFPPVVGASSNIRHPIRITTYTQSLQPEDLKPVNFFCHNLPNAISQSAKNCHIYHSLMNILNIIFMKLLTMRKKVINNVLQY